MLALLLALESVFAWVVEPVEEELGEDSLGDDWCLAAFAL